VPGWHVAPSQHPVGHEVASHVHAPAMQRCPVPQAAVAPQVQLPSEEHESLEVALHPAQTQAPPMHCCPVTHGGPLPQAGPVTL